MDEIINHEEASSRASAPSRSMAQRVEALQRKAENALIRWDAFKNKHSVKPWQFLLAAALVGSLTVGNAVYTKGVEVTVDGEVLGVVATAGEFDAVVEQVEERAGEILGYDYTLESEITYRPRLVEKDKVRSASAFESSLFNDVDDVVSSFVLTVDGVAMGAQTDGLALEELLEEIKAPYVSDTTISAKFAEDVSISYEYSAAGDLKTVSELRKLLTANTMEAVTYEAQKGDSYYGIASKFDMSLSELMAMNPDADADKLMVGDVLTVEASVPFLSVETVDAVTYEETIAPPVEYQEDSSMYQGETKVLKAGESGVAKVSARVTSLNGIEQSREITNTQTLVEPTTKIVAKGTKARPKTMPTGSFIWPVKGTITSDYGYRSIFGSYSYHGGLDIAVSYGTAVKAADGGTVKFAGWQGSYGYLVILDHGNGKTTYYAHNSSLCVSAGQKVYQGQTIAKVGSTGRSTGPHCHFEVRINGSRVNPRNYLP